MKTYITTSKLMMLFLAVFSSAIIPFFADSYEVKQNKVNTAIANCMDNYTHHPFGSEAYKSGCSQCIGLGMAMMDADSQVQLQPLAYQMMIESEACKGLKVKAIKPSIPDSWSVRIPKILLLLSILLFFVPSLPWKKRRSLK